MQRRKKVALAVGLGVGIPVVLAIVLGTLAGMGFYDSSNKCEQGLYKKLKNCKNSNIANMVASGKGEVKLACSGKITSAVLKSLALDQKDATKDALDQLNVTPANIISAALCSAASPTCDSSQCLPLLTVPPSVTTLANELKAKQDKDSPVDFNLASLVLPPTAQEAAAITAVLKRLKLIITPEAYKRAVLTSIIVASVSETSRLTTFMSTLSSILKNLALALSPDPCVVKLASELQSKQGADSPVSFDIYSLIVPPSPQESTAISAVLKRLGMVKVTPEQYKSGIMYALNAACPEGAAPGGYGAFMFAFNSILKRFNASN
jgi:hypothetical protein